MSTFRFRVLPSVKPLAAITAATALFVLLLQHQAPAQDDSDATIGDTAALALELLTNRNRAGDDDPEEMFGKDRGSMTVAGRCHMTERTFQTLETVANRVPIYVPDSSMKLDRIEDKTVDQLWDDIAAAAQGRPPLLYLHGAFTALERACRRVVLFQEAQGLQGRMALFSWPSDGSITNYTRDESDVAWSVHHLEQVLTDMAERFGRGGFDVAAHSLGTRGIFDALTNLHREDPDAGPMVDRIIFFAPDIDSGVFQQNVERISGMVRWLTIYVSDNDRALALAEGVHGVARLGTPGPHLEALGGVRNMEIIDISNISVQFAFGHTYHNYNTQVRADVRQILSEGKSASQRTNLTQTGPNYWVMNE